MKTYVSFPFFCAVAGIAWIGVSPAHATNGTYTIGVTPASQAMGGTGVAEYTTDGNAIFRNPALLSSPGLPQGSAELGLSYFKLNSAAEKVGAGSITNGATVPLSPSGAAGYRVSQTMAVGLAFFPIGGSYADYTSASSLNKLKSEYNVSRLLGAFSVSSSESKFSLGVAPFLTLGKFGLNGLDLTGAQTTNPTKSATGYGVEVGLAYQPSDQLAMGLTYISKSKMNFEQVMDLEAFGLSGADSKMDDFVIEQPEELAFGVKYGFSPKLTLTADYRFIRWHDALGTKDLGWSDQHVIALGTQYKMSAMTLRAGFNYGTPVLNSSSNPAGITSVDVQRHSILQLSQSLFATAGFPALTTTHISGGAGYEFNSKIGADLAFIYAFKGEVSRPGQSVPFQGSASQWSVAADGRITF